MHVKGLVAGNIDCSIAVETIFSLDAIGLAIFGLKDLADFEFKTWNAFFDPEKGLLLIVC